MSIQKSTIVRTFNVLEKVAPGLGGRLAYRLWFAVPETKPRPTNGQRLNAALYGRSMAVDAWGDPADPVVFLVHGWGGRRSDLAAFVEPLVDKGFRVIAFDAPGHGESAPGPVGAGRSTIFEFSALLEDLSDRYGPPHAVIAHSLGCMAVAHSLRNGVPAGRVVFIAPMANAHAYTHEFARRLGFGERIRTRMVARIERAVGPMAVFDLPAIAGRIDRPPLLLVHDREDRETRYTDSEDIRAAWPGADLLATTGLGHRRILRDPDVVARVTGFAVAELPA